MSNTYFEIKSSDHSEYNGNTYDTESSLTLTAFVGAKDRPDAIQITIHSVSNVKGNIDTSSAYISLSRYEQDQLIAGILERRLRISATGSETSVICPSEVE